VSAAKEHLGAQEVVGANVAIFLLINPHEGQVVPPR